MTDDTPGLFPRNADSAEDVPAAPPASIGDPARAITTYPCVSCDRFAFPSAGTVCWWCGRNGCGEDEQAEATRDDRNTPPSRLEALTDA